MTLPFSSFALSHRFFRPLLDTLNSPLTAPFQRSCPSLPDPDWLRFGTFRALECFPSGRAFLQHLSSLDPTHAPARSLFFENLKSERRLRLSEAANHALCRQLDALLPDPLAAYPDLAGWHVFAGDGHYHAAACHDARDPQSGTKYATGHFFGLNLRSHTLFHLTVADQLERKHEHDLRALKRLSIPALRRDARRKEQVLWVWDRAAIDFRFWASLKERAGIYLLSRDKTNTKLQTLGVREVDRSDPMNDGVQSDEFVGSSNGVHLRRIRFFDVLTGEAFTFLTNEFTLPPGLHAHLYRLRWNIEKVFDELKNKLGEGKAWASTSTAKSAQAQFLCLAHNLMLRLEHDLCEEDGIRNEAEMKRRADRLRLSQSKLHRDPLFPNDERQFIPISVLLTQRLTQRSVKFIRWLRDHLFSDLSWPSLIAPLRLLYANS